MRLSCVPDGESLAELTVISHPVNMSDPDWPPGKMDPAQLHNQVRGVHTFEPTHPQFNLISTLPRDQL